MFVISFGRVRGRGTAASGTQKRSRRSAEKRKRPRSRDALAVVSYTCRRIPRKGGPSRSRSKADRNATGGGRGTHLGGEGCAAGGLRGETWRRDGEVRDVRLERARGRRARRARSPFVCYFNVSGRTVRSEQSRGKERRRRDAGPRDGPWRRGTWRDLRCARR